MEKLNPSISFMSEIFLQKDYSARNSVRLNTVPSTGSLLAYSMASKLSSAEVAPTSLEEVSDSSSSYLDDESESDIVEEYYRLTEIENVGIISVLEDTIDQLEILTHLLPHSFGKYEGYETLEERHGGGEGKSLMYPEEGDTDVENILMKVQRDRLFAEAVVVRTVLDLERNNTYEPLEEAIINIQQMDEDDSFLLDEVARHEREVERLGKVVKLLEKGMKTAVEEAEWAAVHLKEQAHATMVQMAIRTRYVSRWEQARGAQKGYINSNEEKRLRDYIGQNYIEIDSEHRTNQEIETYIAITKQELEDSIERWMELYDRESEERDQAIIQLRMEREVHMRSYMELQETFTKHREEMDEWLVIKEERRIRAEHEAFLNKMATRIQAWWRGTMYRKKLGPYRKKKKGGKGGKGGGKGGSQKGKPTKRK